MPLIVDDSSIKAAHPIGNMGTGNTGLDFTFYLPSCDTCAMQILPINMEIMGPPPYLWNG